MQVDNHSLIVKPHLLFADRLVFKDIVLPTKDLVESHHLVDAFVDILFLDQNYIRGMRPMEQIKITPRQRHPLPTCRTPVLHRLQLPSYLL